MHTAGPNPEHILLPSRASSALALVPDDAFLSKAAASTPVVSIISYIDGDVDALAAAESLLRQSLASFEWIALANSSTAFAGPQDPRRKVVGVAGETAAAALDRGVALARASIVLFVAPDARLEPTCVEKLALSLTSYKDAAWAYPGVLATSGARNSAVWMEDFEPRRMFDDCLIPQIFAVRRSDHDEVGSFASVAGKRLGAFGSESTAIATAKTTQLSIAELFWHYWMAHVLRRHNGVLIREVLAEVPQSAGYQPDPHSGVKYRTQAQSDPEWTGGYRPSRWPLYLAGDHLPLLDPENAVVAPQALNGPPVMILSNHFVPGGADRFTLAVAEALKAAGSPVVFALSERTDSTWLDLAYATSRDLFMLPHTVRTSVWLNAVIWLIRSRGIKHVLVTQSLWGFHAAPLLAHELDDVVFFDYTHIAEPNWLAGGYSRLSGLMHEVWSRSFTNTRHLADYMIENYSHDPEKLEVIRCGIDVDREFNPENYSRTESRKKFGLTDETLPVILHVSRLTVQKRPESLPAISAELSKRGQRHLMLIAGGEDDARAKLESQFAELGISENLKLMPYIRDVAPLMRAADCFLLPSRNEGLPIVFMEAMAFGVPIVASDVGGNSELVNAETGGILVPLADEITGDVTPEECAKYADGLMQVLGSRRPDDELSAAARQRVCADFSLESSAAMLVRRMLEPGWFAAEALDRRKARISQWIAQAENAYINRLPADADFHTYSLSYLERDWVEKQQESMKLWQNIEKLGREWEVKEARILELEAILRQRLGARLKRAVKRVLPL